MTASRQVTRRLHAGAVLLTVAAALMGAEPAAAAADAQHRYVVGVSGMA